MKGVAFSYRKVNIHRNPMLVEIGFAVWIRLIREFVGKWLTVLLCYHSEVYI